LTLADVTSELERRAGIRVDAAGATVVGGGSINQAFRVCGDGGPLFVKINDADALPAFEAEAEGLAALEAGGGIAVPATIALGRAGDTAYLVLEWVELAERSTAAQARLGAGLARQHRNTAESFGWHRDNTIGATSQRNAASASWQEFLADQRLGYQLSLAAQQGFPAAGLAQGRRLLGRLEEFFQGRSPEASLLHGDLWSGNWGADATGTPFIFDPAVYYGDREADLAMTRLFGGFGSAFYSAYEREWPLDAGWEARVDLYNLYHLLNHYNLFGAGYLPQIEACLDRLARRADQVRSQSISSR